MVQVQGERTRRGKEQAEGKSKNRERTRTGKENKYREGKKEKRREIAGTGIGTYRRKEKSKIR